MKGIKDYLHLYLGCKVVFNEETIWQLCGVHNAYIVLDGGAFGVIKVTDYATIRPLLRPLSGMTREEFEAFREICEDDFSEMVVIESVSKDGDFTRLCHQAKSQEFLLAMNFDLFGLIDSGLAVDFTTLNNEPDVQVSDTTMLK